MAGLAAGALLCARGVRVVLFEANAKAGGCCAATRLEGYTFSDGAVYLAMPAMLDRLFEMLALDRARLLPLRRISALQYAVLPDGSAVDIRAGPEVTIEGAHGVRSTAQLRPELERFLAKWEPMLRIFADDILVHPLSLPRLLGRTWRHLPLLRGTVASQLEASFSGEPARAAFAAALLYTGTPADQTPATALLALAAMLRDGYFLPEGGMGRLPEVLAEAVRERGGDIRLGASVRRILVAGGRARGVELADGEVFEADAVICTAGAMSTYGTLLSAGEVPARVARKARRAHLSHKGFVLQLGLSRAITARGHTHCVVPWLHEQREAFRPEGNEARWPVYTVPTLTMPELAPPGCSLVEMYPPIRQDLAPCDWSDERKEEVAGRAIDRLRRDHRVEVAACRVLSPREFARDLHLHEGALYGLSPTGGPGALFPHRSPIRGLYQAGQTTWPGFGVVSAGISGVFAAEAQMRDCGVRK